MSLVVLFHCKALIQTCIWKKSRTANLVTKGSYFGEYTILMLFWLAVIWNCVEHKACRLSCFSGDFFRIFCLWCYDDLLKAMGTESVYVLKQRRSCFWWYCCSCSFMKCFSSSCPEFCCSSLASNSKLRFPVKCVCL